MQRSPACESALNLLRQRYDHEWVAADRGLFEDMNSYNKSWKQVYDPEKAEALYLLARENGIIGVGTYRQWKRLAEKHGVPASLLLPHSEQAAEVGEFTVSAIEESERSDYMFAVASPELLWFLLCLLPSCPRSLGRSSSRGSLGEWLEVL